MGIENNTLILFKLGIGLLGLVAFVCLKQILDKLGWRDRTFIASSLALWLLSRLGLFVLVFLIAGFSVPSDVPTYYYLPAKMVLVGKLPYRDFATSYGPLFPYIGAAAVSIWDSPKSIVLLAILIEGASILLWLSISNKSLGVRERQLGLLLYLCNGLPTLNVAIAGQNQIWMSCFLAAAFVLSVKHRELIAGMLLGMSAVAVKILVFLFLPYWWLMSKNRTRLALGVVLALAAGFLPFWLIGADIFQPMRKEGGLISSGNLPYLATLFGLDPSLPTVSAVLTVFLVTALAVTSLWLFRTARRNEIAVMSLIGLAVLLLVFMLLSKKSYTNYYNLLMLPICFSAAKVLRRSWQQVAFLMWSALAALEPSLWHRWLSQGRLGEGGSRMLRTHVFEPHFIAFVLTELILLAGNGCLLYCFVRELLTCKRTQPQTATRGATF
jgi:hypothetical protein